MVEMVARWVREAAQVTSATAAEAAAAEATVADALAVEVRAAEQLGSLGMK